MNRGTYLVVPRRADGRVTRRPLQVGRSVVHHVRSVRPVSLDYARAAASPRGTCFEKEAEGRREGLRSRA